MTKNTLTNGTVRLSRVWQLLALMQGVCILCKSRSHNLMHNYCRLPHLTLPKTRFVFSITQHFRPYVSCNNLHTLGMYHTLALMLAPHAYRAYITHCILWTWTKFRVYVHAATTAQLLFLSMEPEQATTTTTTWYAQNTTAACRGACVFAYTSAHCVIAYRHITPSNHSATMATTISQRHAKPPSACEPSSAENPRRYQKDTATTTFTQHVP